MKLRKQLQNETPKKKHTDIESQMNCLTYHGVRQGENINKRQNHCPNSIGAVNVNPNNVLAGRRLTFFITCRAHSGSTGCFRFLQYFSVDVNVESIFVIGPAY